MTFIPVPGAVQETFEVVRILPITSINVSAPFQVEWRSRSRGFVEHLTRDRELPLGVFAGMIASLEPIAPKRPFNWQGVGSFVWRWATPGACSSPLSRKSGLLLCAGGRGYSFLLLALFYYVIDGLGSSLVLAFVWIGMNPITIYLAHKFLRFDNWPIASSEAPSRALWQWRSPGARRLGHELWVGMVPSSSRDLPRVRNTSFQPSLNEDEILEAPRCNLEHPPRCRHGFPHVEHGVFGPINHCQNRKPTPWNSSDAGFGEDQPVQGHGRTADAGSRQPHELLRRTRSGNPGNSGANSAHFADGRENQGAFPGHLTDQSGV